MTKSKHTRPSTGPVHRSALGRCVDDVERFAATVWGKEPHRYRGQGDFRDLLSIDQIDELLELSARRPTFRLVRDGVTIPPTDYTSTIRLGGASVSDIANVPRLAAAVGDGATLVLQGLERIHAPIRTFAATLHREISHPVRANAYLSPPGVRGLGRHADDHDVFVLQVVGSKGWDVDGLGALTLAAGDTLYMPRGTQHAAATSEHVSLHITVGIAAVTYRDVVRRAIGDATGLGGSLPLGFATERGLSDDDVRDALDRAVFELTNGDTSRIVEREQQRAMRPARIGRFTDEIASLAATAASRVRCRAGLQPVLTVDDGWLEIAFDDRCIRMPATGRPALEQLFAGRWVCVDELRGLDAASRLVVARRLLREGLLDLDDVESSWSGDV